MGEEGMQKNLKYGYQGYREEEVPMCAVLRLVFLLVHVNEWIDEQRSETPTG